jgi:2-oxoglutarate ferredoxin oxidoreductase subunit gamma
MLAADYGGEMRGGPTQASVVVGDAPLRALPILPFTESVILMHHKHSEHARSRLVPGGLALINSSIVDAGSLGSDAKVVGLPVTALARELGAPQAAGFVLMGAFLTLRPLTGLDALADAMRELLPPYRAQHADLNARAIELGAERMRAQTEAVA